MPRSSAPVLPPAFVWGNQSAKIVLLLATLILEYAPVSIWRAVGARFGSSC
ncbi:MAG TPA: hypothetical protein VK595_11790 [Vicinamibacterales bacterium]|nr:hypothetical protein [Vicinamibacterales bacterium]